MAPVSSNFFYIYFYLLRSNAKAFLALTCMRVHVCVWGWGCIHYIIKQVVHIFWLLNISFISLVSLAICKEDLSHARFIDNNNKSYLLLFDDERRMICSGSFILLGCVRNIGCDWLIRTLNIHNNTTCAQILSEIKN